MKKTFLYTAAALLSLSLFSACDLDCEPETSLTDTGYWKSETDLRNACNYFYSLMSGDMGGFSHDYRADLLRGKSDNSTSTGNWTVPNSSSYWSTSYKVIAAANNILEKGPQADVPSNVLAKYEAEARFFRGYYYFHLVKKYGDVPLILRTVKSTDDAILMSPRSPREEVMAQVFEDLKFAADNLPDIDKQDWGKASRSAALGMLVRAGLYEGTYIKYHGTKGDSKADLKIAIDAAETLMKEGKHALYNDYEKLFLFDGEGRKNKENIFVKVYGPNNAGTTVHGNARQLENEASMTRKMVDMYLYTDGLPIEKTSLKIANEKRFNDVFENRDPRFAMTCFKCGEEAYKGALLPFFEGHAGYYLKKGFLLSEWSTNSKETIDKAIIRYAEVLISYAEALYEYNGSITDDQLDQTVNALRARVGFGATLSNSFASANGLNILNEIRRERAVEFVDEGFRYDDIIRWKTAETELVQYILGARLSTLDTSAGTVDQLKDRITTGGGFYKGVKVCDQDSIYVLELKDDRKFNPAKDYLYPIPLQEISRSNGAVTQNPGWE